MSWEDSYTQLFARVGRDGANDAMHFTIDHSDYRMPCVPDMISVSRFNCFLELCKSLW